MLIVDRHKARSLQPLKNLSWNGLYWLSGVGRTPRASARYVRCACYEDFGA